MKNLRKMKVLTKEEQRRIFGGELKKVVVIVYRDGKWVRVEKYIET